MFYWVLLPPYLRKLQDNFKAFMIFRDLCGSISQVAKWHPATEDLY